uniref:TIM barrel protein n=1 Tax=Delftia sp. TaxID=1886637 RepID=UPI00259CE714
SGIQVQMDLYHCQIVEGDLAMKIRQYLPTGRVGHLQIAGVPERQEPDVGEVNYPYLFRLLDQLGYDGWIGCEYRPARGAAAHATSEGLGWMKEWLQATFPPLNATTCAGASGRGPGNRRHPATHGLRRLEPRGPRQQPGLTPNQLWLGTAVRCTATVHFALEF